MKRISQLILSLFFGASLALAQTPPPGSVQLRGATDNTKIGNVSDALKVNITSIPTTTVNQGTQGSSGSPWWVNVTNANIPVTQSGVWSVGVNNFPASYPVTGTFWQATQPVSLASLPPLATGTNTIGAISNTTFDVGNFPVSYPVTGTFWQAVQPVSGPLTDTQLRASPVPVSGPLTDSELRATPVPVSVSGSVTVVDPIAVTQSGLWTVDVSNFPAVQPISATSLPLPTGASTSALQTSGNASLTSIDGKLTTTGSGLEVDGSGVIQPVSGTVAATQSGLWSVDVNNFPSIQAVSQSGAWTVAVNNFPSIQAVSQSGVWTTGRTWTLSSGTDSVNVGNFPATQAVTQSGTWNVGLNAGANTIGIVDQGAGGASAWKVDGSAVTQPISAASLPLPTGASTEATLSTLNGKVPSGLTVTSTRLLVDGSGVTQPVSGTVSVSGSVAVTGPLTDAQLRATAVPVSGTVAATQSGTWTVQPGNTANTTAWKVDGSAVTQPVSAASLPLPSGAATSANQTNATQKTQVVDGSGNVIASTNNQLQTRDTINVSSQYQAISVTTSASEAKGAGSRLTNRKLVVITPTDGTVYWGTSSGVTTANGTPIFTNQSASFSFTDNVQIWLISGGTVNVRIVEGS
jgi:hypothetical protein